MERGDLWNICTGESCCHVALPLSFGEGVRGSYLLNHPIQEVCVTLGTGRAGGTLLSGVSPHRHSLRSAKRLSQDHFLVRVAHIQ